MSNTITFDKNSELESLSVPAFGYELLREIMLPELLGKDTASILYWAGKSLARKYPLSTLEEVMEFFQKAGWGNLILKKESKSELELELASDLITTRLLNQPDSPFQLEAGFLAQQVEFQKNVVTETYEHPKKRGSKVQFTVKWDKKDVSE